MFSNFYCLLGVIFTITSLTACSPKDNSPTSAPHGMVASAHKEASFAGRKILAEGGNAVDAAIATQFALAVVYPTAGNIGGGGFMVTRTDTTIQALDFRERAPLEAHKQLFQNPEGDPVPQKSLKGHRAAGTPGTVAGMVRAHQQWGSLPFARLLKPAIRLARAGFPVTENQADRINKHLDEFRRYSTFRPSPFIRPDQWRKGDTLKRPNLARTLARIRSEGRAGFYSGKTARYIVNEMNRCDGLITHKDLQSYRSRIKEPVSIQFKGYGVHSMPPPSAGGIALAQMLKIVEPFPLADWGLASGKTRHIMAEAMKLAYADRSRHIGDPQFFDVPQKQLLDSAYLAKRREKIRLSEAIDSKTLKAGDLSFDVKGQTTHFSVVDSSGNAVSVTTTLNTEYGSKVYVGRAGFFLNSEMNDFSLKPGYPNIYGLRSGGNNAIKPGKRMVSSMTPTLVTKNDSLYAALGSPGGSTIITTVFQTLLNITVFDMPMQAAVNHGRFHHQWKPDYLLMEYQRPFSLATIVDLFGRGQPVVPFVSIGSVDAIMVRNDGTLAGGADPRGCDTAVGY